MTEISAPEIFNSLVKPMLRLLCGMAMGILVANILEALNWSRHLARFAAPLARLANLGEAAAQSFSLAFVSPSASNAVLSQKLEAGEMSGKEVVLANIFNSLPAYLMHTPTIFLLLWPVIGMPAIIYIGLTLAAAAARTALIAVVGRLILPPQPEHAFQAPQAKEKRSPREILAASFKRLLRRLPKLAFFTIPIYILMYYLQHNGFFHSAEMWMSANLSWLSFLKPQAMSIIVLHLAAELGAALSAAGSVLHSGALSSREIVAALMVGNILSTPMRALRHQLPSYAGWYSPGLALRLVLANQGLRAASLIVITWLYLLG